MSGFYEVVTAPATPVVSLEEAKAFLRIENTADDDLIEALILAAINSAELYMNRVLGETEFRLSVLGGSRVKIMRSPLVSIDSIEAWDEGAYSPLSGYLLYGSNSFPIVDLRTTVDAPTDTPYGVVIEFTAGWSTVPPVVKQALLMHVNYLYENRGDVEAEGKVPMPTAVKMMYRQYRIIATYGTPNC